MPQAEEGVKEWEKKYIYIYISLAIEFVNVTALRHRSMERIKI